MARKRSPARLVVALSVAAVLAVFLIYTAIAGGTPSLRPSQLAGHTGRVSLTGMVVGRVTGDAHQTRGLRFTLRDRNGKATVPVVYRGSVPDLFRSGRDVMIDGRLKNGVFVAYPGTLVTKCPSKYSPKKS
ncbi:MAG TPA: cytochrome c maturation protein CcmE [Gaiellaceae bacterium]